MVTDFFLCRFERLTCELLSPSDGAQDGQGLLRSRHVVRLFARLPAELIAEFGLLCFEVHALRGRGCELTFQSGDPLLLITKSFDDRLLTPEGIIHFGNSQR